MEQWEQDYAEQFVVRGSLTKVDPLKVKRFIQKLLKEERKRDKLQELIDYVKKSKSNTEILINYCDNQRKDFCNRTDPSQELLDELGINIYEREVMILYYLEKHFNPPKETGT